MRAIEAIPVVSATKSRFLKRSLPAHRKYVVTFSWGSVYSATDVNALTMLIGKRPMRVVVIMKGTRIRTSL